MAKINIAVSGSGSGRKSIFVNSDELKANGITGQRMAYSLNRSAKDVNFAANLRIMLNRSRSEVISWLNAEMIARP